MQQVLFNQQGEHVATVEIDRTSKLPDIISLDHKYYVLQAGRYVEANVTAGVKIS